ncbi:MAG: ANTAR domain-containing response regulator [Methylosarcina sp.]
MLNVLLVENGINSTILENALCSDGANVIKTQHGPFFFTLVKEIRPDVIIIHLDTPTDEILADLHVLNQKFPLPVILFACHGSHEIIDKVIKAEVSAFILDGLDSHRIGGIIQVAMARFKHQQALKQALEDARTQLEDRKQIDRAKAILIKTQNFTENDAYHTLRKLAMDRNITLGEMARNVIAMAELLK